MAEKGLEEIDAGELKGRTERWGFGVRSKRRRKYFYMN